jgi:hypothetical protein
MERLWQVRLSSRNRLPLFPTEVSQRRAVRRLAAVTRGRLVLFGLVYEHGHPIVFCSDERIGLLKRSIRIALRPVAAQPIEPVWAEPVGGRGHMRALLRYVLEQPSHHCLPDHPALWSGSCFLDLCGARSLPGLSLRIAEALPGLRLGELHEIVGLPRRPIEPATDEQILELGARRLVLATAAALALDPESRGLQAVAARRLVVQIGRRVGISWAELRRVLSVSEATLFRSATSPFSDEELERAVRIRLALEELIRVESRPGSHPPGREPPWSEVPQLALGRRRALTDARHPPIEGRSESQGSHRRPPSTDRRPE